MLSTSSSLISFGKDSLSCSSCSFEIFSRSSSLTGFFAGLLVVFLFNFSHFDYLDDSYFLYGPSFGVTTSPAHDCFS